MNIRSKSYGFSAISIKSNIAARFRKFSKKVGRSHSETLQSMLDFFEWHEISPNDSLGPNMISLENRLKKRINALVAIIKNIEKHQTKPTNAMLQLLFQENTQDYESSEDTFEFEQQQPITENEELEHYRNRYHEVQKQFRSLLFEMQKILDRTRFIKGSFGGGYLKLDMTRTEFEKIKLAIQDVHHHNKTDR